ADSKLQKQIRKAFEGSLSSARQKVANASQEEIDQLLRQDDTVVRLALIMKEQHLESPDELDLVLAQFGTTLERQINNYGEYMMGMEAARSKLKEEHPVTEKEMLEYYEE